MSGLIRNMVNKVISRIKDIISKQDKKKVIENCIIIIIVGIIIIIAGGALVQNKDDRVTDGDYITGDRINTGMGGSMAEKDAGSGLGSWNEGLEEKMESILSQIAGAGEVKVMITYA
ncbi:MAG: hypothetical protein GX754_11535, partial [Clostridiaceae bacterium]|nr:hypothetical protein [Clostridiaceae bacterium]